MPVPSFSTLLADRLHAAVGDMLPDPPFAAQVRRSAHADFQADGVLALAKALGRNPRELATAVAARLGVDDVVAAHAVAGPGFVNLTLTDGALLRSLADRLADPRLGVGRPEHGVTTVVDYSQPNVAKELHVGHLRSTIIGDALVRVLGHLGGTVLRQNHVGDWGTQFGMLIQHQCERPGDGGDLTARYRAARALFERDPAFAERSRRRVVALQAGDPDSLAAWRAMVAESTGYFTEVYRRLGVLLTPADTAGESRYNPMLPGIADALERLGVAELSDGALCVFFPDVVGPDGTPVPLIVRKSDGGFGYAATDLAALRHRVEDLHADRIVYVVDARQALHFRMVFDTAARAGWLPGTVHAVHAAFGTVLRTDGRPFKTRDGETARLVDLLTAAVDRARAIVAAKHPALDPDTLAERADQVGIGAVKYADLSTGRTRDYVYDPERMLSLAGNTSVYLQYAHVRVRSILARAGMAGTDVAPPVAPDAPLDPAERALLLHLDGFGDVLAEVARDCEPHRLCGYLYGLAQALTAFYDRCLVLRAPEPVRGNRLALCRLTADTLRTGLDLLGIAAPDRL